MKLSLYDALVSFLHQNRIQHRIGYRFKDIRLFKLAMTHGSTGGDSNERLEFLGDSVLGLVMAEMLYKQYPDVSEGTLTQLRIMSVNNTHLQGVAEELGLDDELKIGKGLAMSSDRGVKMYADAVEALIGAIYMDGGFKPARKFVEKHVKLTIPKFEEKDLHPKTALSHWAQQNHEEFPIYEVVQDPATKNGSHWVVKCSLERYSLTRTGASRRSRRAAETEAARQILQTLDVMSNGN